MSEDAKILKHGRNSALAGRTLCGLEQFSASVKFAKSRKAMNCPECITTLKRLAPTRSAHATAQYQARRKQALANLGRPRGKY